MNEINTPTVNSFNVNANTNANRTDNVESKVKSPGNNRAREMPVEQKNDQQVDSAAQAEKAQISASQLEMVAQKLQDFVGEMNKGLKFSVDQDSGRDVIKVIDKNSGDLIKQYPTEEVLDLVAKLSEATGNFINTDV